MHTPLAIAKPCHENWNKMSDNLDGKFCSSCQKTVHDLTRLSDTELIAFLNEKGYHVCGKFRTEQLDETPEKRIPFFNSFSLKAASIAALLFTRLFAPNAAKAQDMKYNYNICPKTDGANTINTVNTNTTVYRIKGKVIDHKDGQALENARVYIIVGNNTIESTYTDSLGNFTLKAETKNSSAKMELVVKMAGYKTNNYKNDSPDGESFTARLRVDKNYRYYSMGCPSF